MKDLEKEKEKEKDDDREDDQDHNSEDLDEDYEPVPESRTATESGESAPRKSTPKLAESARLSEPSLSDDDISSLDFPCPDEAADQDDVQEEGKSGNRSDEAQAKFSLVEQSLISPLPRTGGLLIFAIGLPYVVAG